MPKMNKTMAKQVEESEETAGFAPVPDGLYRVRLVEVTVGEGAKGPYWTWKYEIPEDAEEYAGKLFWNTTSLSEKAQGMPQGLKRTFAAFGMPATTDTDDLCGEYVVIQTSVVTQQQGKNAGQKVNEITNIFPADYEPDSEEEPF